MVLKFFLRLFIFFAVLAGLSFIFTPSVSGTGGSASQPFIFDGTVVSMVKQQGYVGSTYNVQSSNWGLTFQVTVEPGHGSIDDGIRVGDKVQVCGERGVGINQTQVKIKLGNHYITRTGLAASPISTQPEAMKQAVQPQVTQPDSSQAASPDNSKDNGWSRAMARLIAACGGFKQSP